MATTTTDDTTTTTDHADELTQLRADPARPAPGHKWSPAADIAKLKADHADLRARFLKLVGIVADLERVLLSQSPDLRARWQQPSAGPVARARTGR